MCETTSASECTSDLAANKLVMLLFNNFMEDVVDFVQCRRDFIWRSLNANTIDSLSFLNSDFRCEIFL